MVTRFGFTYRSRRPLTLFSSEIGVTMHMCEIASISCFDSMLVRVMCNRKVHARIAVVIISILSINSVYFQSHNSVPVNMHIDHRSSKDSLVQTAIHISAQEDISQSKLERTGEI